MKKILEISDKDFGFDVKDVDYKPRTAARSVVFDGKNVALMHVSKKGYYKLPGGGVEQDEGIKEALHREIKEEAGCTVKILEEIGEIIEHKSHRGIVQTSHCFFSKVIEKGESELEEGEIADGFELIWVEPQRALELLKITPKDYSGTFITKRDAHYMKEAMRFLKN